MDETDIVASYREWGSPGGSLLDHDRLTWMVRYRTGIWYQKTSQNSQTAVHSLRCYMPCEIGLEEVRVELAC
jgi:hypothetical protein